MQFINMQQTDGTIVLLQFYIYQYNGLKFEQVIAGECLTTEKKYLDKAQCLKNIVYDFKNRMTDEFTRNNT